MAFASQKLRQQLDQHRRRQHEEWAVLSPDQRLRLLLQLRAFVFEIRGTLERSGADEQRELWRRMLERRAALTPRPGAPE